MKRSDRWGQSGIFAQISRLLGRGVAGKWAGKGAGVNHDNNFSSVVQME